MPLVVTLRPWLAKKNQNAPLHVPLRVPLSAIPPKKRAAAVPASSSRNSDKKGYGELLSVPLFFDPLLFF